VTIFIGGEPLSENIRGLTTRVHRLAADADQTLPRVQPPSFSNNGPTVFAAWSKLLSVYLAPTSVSPTGIPFSPWKPITFSTGACRIVHIEQND
jgi:hypothetical protein